MGTVRAELAFPLENRGLGAAAVARGVEEAALALGIAHLLDRSTHTLSGGELQRVALGAALAGRPRVALLDEPTSQLDPVAGDELLGVLRRINEEWGTAVVLAEHRLERCLGAADRVVALDRGAVVCDADPRGFLDWAGEPRARPADAGRPPLRPGRPRPAARLGEGRAPRRRRRGPRAGGRRRARRPARGRSRRAGSCGGAAPRGPSRRSRSPRSGSSPRAPRRSCAAPRSTSRPASASRSWAATAPASRRSCASPRGCSSRPAARSARRAASRCCCRTRATTRCATASATSCRADALAAAGLDGLADRHPRDLSGGERQRLALAIVLHGPRPAVVCLDEPTRGMDRGAQGPARRAAARARGGGQRGRRRHARRRVRRRLRHPHRAARRRARRGRRADGGRAGRRLVLRHADGAHPRRRGAAARGRRRPAAARGGRPVSWIAASMLVLGLALAAGFGWYERSHPSARVLALVAALAALAVIGRIAFAPFPNVKPTTDIVLLTGYVLGGAPGFAVGAVAALASNLFFGQGPWTPWQMVGWGGVGLFGAALARLAGRDLGRVPLAAACAVASLGYGFLQNVSLWITFSGDHSLAKLWFYMSTSFVFDVAHATGSVLFCLAFGPALVRALRRYRTRFEVTWRPGPVTAGVGAVLIALAVAQPPSADAAAPPRGRALPRGGAERRRRLRARARARRRRRCTRAGWCSGSPRPACTRARWSAGARTRWTSCARTRAPCAATWASARGRCSRCARRARRRSGWGAATCWASCCARRSATGRSRASSTRRRSPSWPCARPGSRRAIPPCGAPSRSSPARRTRTAASTSPARAVPRAPTTRAPRCRRSARAAGAARASRAGPPTGSSATRTRTAASPCRWARATRSRRRGRCRA